MLLGMLGRTGVGYPLFGRDVLELDGRVVVRATTGGTQTIHGGLDVVVAELTDLAARQYGRRMKGPWHRPRTW
jgi:hypothetical protein